ncbi:MAG: alpha/beta hydrolase [bacterium]
MTASLLTPWVADYLYRSIYHVEDSQNELHKVKTSDGVEVALWRYPNRNENPGEPVLLVHGLGANHRNLALDDENGVVQYLAEQGYDCWAIDLRGRGRSDTPSGGWCFDDYAQKDLPAVLDYILETTGYDQLHWIGHSMGGMLYYAVAGALDRQDQIASATTMASPFGMQEPLMVNRLALKLNRLVRKLNSYGIQRFCPMSFDNLSGRGLNFSVPIHKLPQSYLARWAGFLLLLFKRWLPQDFILAYMNPNQVDDATIKKGVNEVVEGVSMGEIVQFADWVLNDRWTDVDQEIDYADGAMDLQVPILMIGGSEDRMTPAHHLKWGFNSMNTRDKKFVIAGKDTGFKHEYAHVDLVLGKNARKEIFPLLVDWLKKHPVKN